MPLLCLVLFWGDKWLWIKRERSNKNEKKKKKSSAQLKKPKQKEKTLKGATLHYFIERGQQLVCSAALGQMIEAADKIECQRADGHGETERGEQRSLVK